MAACPLEDRFVAAMVLGAVGDAMGYKNGMWEVCRLGVTIHSEVEKLGGVSALNLTRRDFMVSDDTVLHIATAEALVSEWKDKETLYRTIAQKYIDGCRDMSGRAPGRATLEGVRKLRPKVHEGYRIPYTPRGGGCGAAMRSAPIGLRFYRSAGAVGRSGGGGGRVWSNDAQLSNRLSRLCCYSTVCVLQHSEEANQLVGKRPHGYFTSGLEVRRENGKRR